MSNQAIRQQVLGILVEEGIEYVEIAEAFEEELITHIREAVQHEDGGVKGARIMGMALAMMKLEEISEEL